MYKVHQVKPNFKLDGCKQLYCMRPNRMRWTLQCTQNLLFTNKSFSIENPSTHLTIDNYAHNEITSMLQEHPYIIYTWIEKVIVVSQDRHYVRIQNLHINGGWDSKNISLNIYLTFTQLWYYEFLKISFRMVMKSSTKHLSNFQADTA